MAVLGISTNSRVLAMAVIHENTLTDFKTQLHKQIWSVKKAKRMIASLHACISEHAVTKVAITIPHDYHTSPETKAFIKTIKAYCQNKEVKLLSYHLPSLYCLCEASKAKKKALINALTVRYPELAYISRKESKHKHRYYNKLFEAVGAATLLAGEFD